MFVHLLAFFFELNERKLVGQSVTAIHSGTYWQKSYFKSEKKTGAKSTTNPTKLQSPIVNSITIIIKRLLIQMKRALPKYEMFVLTNG